MISENIEERRNLRHTSAHCAFYHFLFRDNIHCSRAHGIVIKLTHEFVSKSSPIKTGVRKNFLIQFQVVIHNGNTTVYFISSVRCSVRLYRNSTELHKFRYYFLHSCQYSVTDNMYMWTFCDCFVKMVDCVACSCVCALYVFRSKGRYFEFDQNWNKMNFNKFAFEFCGWFNKYECGHLYS